MPLKDPQKAAEYGRRKWEETKARMKVDPEFAAKTRAMWKSIAQRWNVANPGRRNEITKRWRYERGGKEKEKVKRETPEGREKQRQRAAAYRYNNPDKYIPYRKAKESRRRARKRGRGEHHTWRQWTDLVNETGNKCLKCFRSGNEFTLHRDHIISLVMSGNDTIANIQPLCAHCNYVKHGSSIDYRLDTFAPMFRDHPEWLTMPLGDEL